MAVKATQESDTNTVQSTDGANVDYSFEDPEPTLLQRYTSLPIVNHLFPTFSPVGSPDYFFETEVQRRMTLSTPRAQEDTLQVLAFEFFVVFKNNYEVEDTAQRIKNMIKELYVALRQSCDPNSGTSIVEQMHIVHALMTDTANAIRSAEPILYNYQ